MASDNDGVYIKNGYVYKDGIGKIHKASEEEKARYGSTPTYSSTSNSSNSSNSSSSSSSSASSSRYNTTITKKDGTTASGYIENDRGYYSDGTALSAGDSIIDAQNKVWTKGGTGSSSSNPGADSLSSYLAQLGISVPTGSSGGSSSSSYKVTSADVPERTSYLRSAQELADLFDINYDMDAIRSIYDSATDAKYALLSKELEQSENDFYANQANANATLLDTLRKATSSAIATGASRGIAGAEQLGLMMEAQQEAVAGATDLAQQRANMADEIAAEKAQNIINALEYTDKLKQGLATNSTNVYSADTQYDVGLLDYYAQMKNVEALFEQINAEKDVNLKAQYIDALKAIMDDTTTRSEGDKNRASNEKQNSENAAVQKAYYDAMLRNANSSSGSGSNLTYVEELKQLNTLSQEAYAAGDVDLYVAAQSALQRLTGSPETTQQIIDRVNSDPNFPGSEANKGSNNTTGNIINSLFGSKNAQTPITSSNGLYSLNPNTLLNPINLIANGSGANPAFNSIQSLFVQESAVEQGLKSYYKGKGLSDSEITTKLAEYRKADVATQSKIMKEAGLL